MGREHEGVDGMNGLLVDTSFQDHGVGSKT